MRTLRSPKMTPQVKGMPLLWHGIGSLVTAVPAAVLLTMLWSLVLGCLPITWEGENMPVWAAILNMLPMLFAPAWCLWGIVRSFRYKGAPGMYACVIMSGIGLPISIIVCMMFYMVATGQVG